MPNQIDEIVEQYVDSIVKAQTEILPLVVENSAVGNSLMRLVESRGGNGKLLVALHELPPVYTEDLLPRVVPLADKLPYLMAVCEVLGRLHYDVAREKIPPIALSYIANPDRDEQSYSHISAMLRYLGLGEACAELREMALRHSNPEVRNAVEEGAI